MMKLYNFPQSTCSQKVRISLHEKGLDFEDYRVSHKDREHLSEWYLKLNPNGVVPTLDDDGGIVIDSSVILEYLDDVYPDVNLSPENPVRKAAMRKWLRYFEEVPTPAIRVPSFNEFIVVRYQNMTEDEYNALADRHPVRKHFYKRLAAKRFSKQETEEAMDRLQQSIDRVEAALQENGGPWIMGTDFTNADICLLPTIDRLNDLGYSQMWTEKHPKFTAWYEAFKARPSFQATYYAGTRLTELYDERNKAEAAE